MQRTERADTEDVRALGVLDAHANGSGEGRRRGHPAPRRALSGKFGGELKRTTGAFAKGPVGGETSHQQSRAGIKLFVSPTVVTWYTLDR
eukprot:scaffold18610_cov63-Phaeocystis_antarctica.AAC.5